MRPVIVAELGANHAGKIERAVKIVHAAAEAGADAVKFQTWSPELMVLDRDYTLTDGAWKGRKLVDLYAEAHTPWEWHAQLFETAKSAGIEAFTSVFDIPALDFLERLGCPRYKIASFELVDLPLIRAAASTKKPLILSTGMATYAEIHDAVDTARAAGCTDLTLLKCTSAYPADASTANLLTMADMRERFPGAKVGLSDHTKGIGVALCAAGMGARVIEKHFTLKRSDGGLDAAFSIEPDELAMLCASAPACANAHGKAGYGPTTDEIPQLALRRSLYFAKDLPAGAVIDPEAIASARPAAGLSPANRSKLMGKILATDVRRGQPVTWGVLR